MKEKLNSRRNIIISNKVPSLAYNIYEYLYLKYLIENKRGWL